MLCVMVSADGGYQNGEVSASPDSSGRIELKSIINGGVTKQMRRSPLTDCIVHSNLIPYFLTSQHRRSPCYRQVSKTGSAQLVAHLVITGRTGAETLSQDLTRTADGEKTSSRAVDSQSTRRSAQVHPGWFTFMIPGPDVFTLRDSAAGGRAKKPGVLKESLSVLRASHKIRRERGFD